MGRITGVCNYDFVLTFVLSSMCQVVMGTMVGRESETVFAVCSPVLDLLLVELVQVPRNSLRTRSKSWELCCGAVAVSGSV